jgi:hypothetical protein
MLIFTWQATNNTYGAINKGQFFGNASDIIIVIPIAEARAKPMETFYGYRCINRF